MIALNANQLLAEVDSMPIDLKTKLIDKLLRSLTPNSESIDTLWKQEIDKRVNAIESGEVSLVDGNEVFRKIQERFA
ncbi:MAG: addiction module protein [Sulfuricurvum sp.]|uniref:addiction module protein n=1 Tax=Sulfuricurvum sp. TaxID=2025608 RepID=UPI00262A3850|nr:addiction module protein [Sulfuricurvum sp.]MDD2828104.1 addiction module protein [Sulfuricurvum sp.]MDD4948022.1 addiction module protein [Sulfuricurvum sp.]